jgi:hypothetical protein
MSCSSRAIRERSSTAAALASRSSIAASPASSRRSLRARTKRPTIQSASWASDQNASAQICAAVPIPGSRAPLTAIAAASSACAASAPRRRR